MPSQWIIQQREADACNVYWREGLTLQRKQDIYTDLVAEEGMHPMEARAEIEQRESAFTLCNESSPLTRKACLDFVLAYCKPGDCIILDGHPLVFMEPAKC